MSSDSQTASDSDVEPVSDEDNDSDDEESSPDGSEASEDGPDEEERSGSPAPARGRTAAAPKARAAAPRGRAAPAPRGGAAKAAAPPLRAPPAAAPAELAPPGRAPPTARAAAPAAPPAAVAPPSAAVRTPAVRRAAAASEEEEEEDDEGGGGGSDDSDASFDVPGSDSDGDDPVVAFASQQARKAANVKAMLSGKLTVERAPLLPKLLSLTDAQAALRKPFKPPVPGSTATGPSDELRLKLAMQRAFVPWGSKGAAIKLPLAPPPSSACGEEALAPGVEPLQLWPLDGDALPEGAKPILVDNMLVKWLRPHQREGVQFMFECVTDLRKFGGQGCILADDMGLGKTLQAITLMWTLLCQSFDGAAPLAKRVLIVCPTSLVANWDSECVKWLNGRVKTTPIAESTRADVVHSVTQFLSPRNTSHVLIISYETFRLHAERFSSASACDLLICDEAHRLKNDETLTNKALDSLACRRRILLSGTPIQNHLDEFYAMVNFANPGLLGTRVEFHKKYERPILTGREPDASDAEQQRGRERGLELSAEVDKFILRRTNTLLSKHLPPKTIQIVCCPLSPLQTACYEGVLSSKTTKKVINGGKDLRVLNTIMDLKKLCNHPKLIYDSCISKKATDAFQDCMGFFEPGMFDDGRPGRGQPREGWEELGGKFVVLCRLLQWLRQNTDDRIVIVSNYTQTLDLFQQLCREKRYPALRLDGSITVNKRQALVKKFNDPKDNQFVFLLSSKAGGCGLNLIGGNRLVLFDPDWNPANDKQAAGRVWRDGQKKKVFVYRFLSTGTIEEKVYQRQLSKEGLQNLVDAKGKLDMAMMSKEDLRKLFTLRQCSSDTHEFLNCKRCPPKPKVPTPEEAEQQRLAEEAAAQAATSAAAQAKAADKPKKFCPPRVVVRPPSDDEADDEPDPRPWLFQLGKPAEDDLASWGHHEGSTDVPDQALQYAGADNRVSFVFVCQIEGKEVEVTAPVIAPAAAPVPAARGRGPFPGAAPAAPRPSAPPQRPGALHPARPALAPTQPKVTPPQPSGGGEKKATPVRPVAVPQPPKAAPAPAPPVVETMDVDDDDSEPAPHLVAAMHAPAASRRPEVDAAADAKRPKLSASVSAGTASLGTDHITPPAGPSAGAAAAPGGTAIKYGRLTHSSGGARALPPPRDVVVRADDDDDFV